jgi:putative ABC transport system permease protein
MFLVLDDLTIVDAETQETQVFESFEDSSRTLFLNTMDKGSNYDGIYTGITEQFARSGQWSQIVSMGYNRPQQIYPLRLRQTWQRDPLPALVSPAFMQATALQVGDVTQVLVNSTQVEFRIAGAVRYFPTMYEELQAGYLITSRDLLLPLLNEASQSSTNPNEVLIETDGSASTDDLEQIVPLLSTSWQAEDVRQTLKASPLALGLRSVILFGYALTTLLSLVGFATHFYMSARQRQALYGVVRALGMSSRQLYALLALEQAALVLAGLALGTGLGVLLNQITLPRLPVSLGERPPIPPFIPRADWLAVGWLYLGLAAAFLCTLGLVTAILWRARIHRVLRIGQE